MCTALALPLSPIPSSCRSHCWTRLFSHLKNHPFNQHLMYAVGWMLGMVVPPGRSCRAENSHLIPSLLEKRRDVTPVPCKHGSYSCILPHQPTVPRL